MDMKFCTNCHHTTRWMQNKFCEYCGKELEVVTRINNTEVD